MANTKFINGGETYVVNVGDNIVNCDSTAGAIILKLPPITSAGFNWNLSINDTSETAATNSITLQCGANDKINGSNTFVIAQNGAAVMVVVNGLNDYLVSSVTTIASQITDFTAAAKIAVLPTQNRQTASYTLVLGDANGFVEMNVGSANNLTVPPNASVAFPLKTQILISNYGAGQTSIVAGSGVTIRSAGGALKLSVQYSMATLIQIAANEWILSGDITT